MFESNVDDELNKLINVLMSTSSSDLQLFLLQKIPHLLPFQENFSVQRNGLMEHNGWFTLDLLTPWFMLLKLVLASDDYTEGDLLCGQIRATYFVPSCYDLVKVTNRSICSSAIKHLYEAALWHPRGS